MIYRISCLLAVVMGGIFISGDYRVAQASGDVAVITINSVESEAAAPTGTAVENNQQRGIGRRGMRG
jgi:hypothetical protein